MLFITLFSDLGCQQKGKKQEIPDLSHREIAPPPAWANQGVLYQVFPRVFTPEGDFKALQKKLLHVKNLDVDIIWLMPIFPIGEKDRKGTLGSPYAVRDFRSINPEYGSEKDLKELVDSVHQMDMKLILDIVPNHGSNDNRLMKEHPDWYMVDEMGNFTRENPDWSDISDFDYSHPGLREYMQETLIYWVENFDIDGYRCDMAGMVPFEFWENALKKLKEVKEDIYLLAEWEDPEILLTGFHSDYGWTEYHLLKEIRHGKKRTSEITALIQKKNMRYPANALTMRFLENHDELRSLEVFGVEAIEVYTTLLFTSPGIPLIYAGQELGASEKPSLFEKSTLNWQQADSALLGMYGKLVRLRKKYSCFTRGDYKQLAVSQTNGSASAFLREDDQSLAIVIMNLKDVPAEKVLITLPDTLLNRISAYMLRHYRREDELLNTREMFFQNMLPFSAEVYIGKK